jgi:hypothetical protein
MKRTLLLLTLSLLLSVESFGDEVNETIAILCDTSSHEMKIKPVFVNWAHMDMNEIPEGYDLNRRSCEFLNNTEAKIELHEGIASVRGQCGANPPIELRITSARGQPLKFKFSPRCGGLLIESVLIHRDYVKVCYYTELNNKAPWVPDHIASEPNYECQKY